MHPIVVSEDVLYLLPLGVGAVIYILTTDKWPLWLNALLSFVLVAATAVVLILLDPGFIGGNIKASIMLTVAYIVYLMKGPAKPIVDWLRQANMNRKPIDTQITSIGTTAFVPTGSDQPTAVPLRASKVQGTGNDTPVS